MSKSQSSSFTFFAILAYMVALFIVIGLIVGSLSFVNTWWVLLLVLAGGVAFTGTAIREGREAQTDAIVPASSSLVEPAETTEKKPVAAAPEKKPTPKPAAKKPAADKPDDLTRLEGIGPKMSKTLIAGGVDTYAKLADLSVDEIRAVLAEQGTRFAPAAESWAEQASYAAKGDWDGLDALQDTLVAGRYPDS